MLFHFPVDARLIFRIIEGTREPEAVFKNATRFRNERSTILYVATLKLEMFIMVINRTIVKCFRLENVFGITIDRVYLIPNFIPNEHMNKL